MSAITITEENRNQFGGDYAITRTVPKIHPKLGIPLSGLREDIRGASRHWTTLYRGDIIYKADPTADYNFILWSNDGTRESRDMFMLLKREKGFEICDANDWDLRPDLREMYEVENGQLIIRGNTPQGGRPYYDVLMYRTAERMLQEEKALQQLDMIETHAQTKIAEVIDDKRVRVLPTQIEVSPHRYNPEEVSARINKGA